MISDTLFEAVEEIRRYQREIPDVYDDMCTEIDAVARAMKALQLKLDLPDDLLAARSRRSRKRRAFSGNSK